MIATAAERHRQRHQPQPAAEHEREHERHHQHADQQRRSVEPGQRVRQVLDHHGRARDRVPRRPSRRHSGIATASRMSSIARRAPRRQARLQAHLDQRRAFATGTGRRSAPSASSRRARGRTPAPRRSPGRRRSARRQAEPVPDVELEQVADDLRVDELLRRLARARLLGARLALRLGEPPRGAPRPAPPRRPSSACGPRAGPGSRRPPTLMNVPGP